MCKQAQQATDFQLSSYSGYGDLNKKYTVKFHICENLHYITTFQFNQIIAHWHVNDHHSKTVFKFRTLPMAAWYVEQNSPSAMLATNRPAGPPEVNLRRYATHIPLPIVNNAVPKPREDINRSSKQGYQRRHKKDLRPKKLFQKNILAYICMHEKLDCPTF